MNTQHAREILEAEAHTLEMELATVGTKNTENSADWIAIEPEDDRDRGDESDVADGIQNLEINTAIVDQLEPRLGEVRVALQKITDGTYGTCEVCNNPIEEDRLSANPAAKTCKAHM